MTQYHVVTTGNTYQIELEAEGVEDVALGMFLTQQINDQTFVSLGTAMVNAAHIVSIEEVQ